MLAQGEVCDFTSGSKPRISRSAAANLIADVSPMALCGDDAKLTHSSDAKRRKDDGHFAVWIGDGRLQHAGVIESPLRLNISRRVRRDVIIMHVVKAGTCIPWSCSQSVLCLEVSRTLCFYSTAGRENIRTDGDAHHACTARLKEDFSGPTPGMRNPVEE